MQSHIATIIRIEKILNESLGGLAKLGLLFFYIFEGRKMEHKKLIEDLLDDCNSLETLADYISLVPEMEQLHTHLISIKNRVREAVDILKGGEE